jgi:cellulose synthase/poly-beta-1,6-N-acetylglucosamine synthase-like glycosyltransferase
MLGLMNGIHVTPGPFSIYRIAVFKNLGLYKLAHKTEDMEIAYRMHAHGYRIEQCHDAVVNTKTPPTIYKLYKQRLRWIYGFINNTIDYRKLVFRKKYGAFALFTIPAGIVSIVAASYLFVFMIYSWAKIIIHKIVQIQAVGVTSVVIPTSSTFDWFYVSTHSLVFISIILYGFVFLSLLIGSKMATGKFRPSIAMVWYILVYSIIAPVWIITALYKTIIGREVAWR